MSQREATGLTEAIQKIIREDELFRQELVRVIQAWSGTKVTGDTVAYNYFLGQIEDNKTFRDQIARIALQEVQWDLVVDDALEYDDEEDKEKEEDE